MAIEKVILVANTDWYLYNFRLSLARYLREQGMQVILVSPEGRFVPKLKDAGFQWEAWNFGRKSIAIWSEAAAFFRILDIYRRLQPDLIHQHTIKPVIYGSLAAKRLGVPAYVNSITGRGYIFSGEGLKAQVVRTIVKKLYYLAFLGSNCSVIFENEADRQYFLSQGLVNENQTRLIEGVGVNPARFFPKPEPAGHPVILFPARMLWDKGVGTMVEAARIVRKNTPARVVLVGDIDPGNPATLDRATLNRWVEEGVIEWWGWQESMEKVYSECHIVALPSLHEGVPTVLIEAAACAKPIVASDIPGCRTVVTDGINGFLVSPHDPSALAGALQNLINDPELRRKMGEAGRKLVLNKFDNQVINSATLDTYHSLSAAAV